MPKGSRERDRRPSATELKAVIKAAGAIHAEMPVIIEVAVETAMRRGELLTLRRADIKGKHALLEDTKNGSRRLVPLSIRARALLDSLPARIDGQVFSLTEKGTDLFISEKGTDLFISDKSAPISLTAANLRPKTTYSPIAAEHKYPFAIDPPASGDRCSGS
nr:tyrosine-type recombinase/integrase [Pseudomonas gessardii]